MEQALEQLKTISEADYTKVKSLAAIVKHCEACSTKRRTTMA
jgi:hypothetical protein